MQGVSTINQNQNRNEFFICFKSCISILYVLCSVHIFYIRRFYSFDILKFVYIKTIEVLPYVLLSTLRSDNLTLN